MKQTDLLTHIITINKVLEEMEDDQDDISACNDSLEEVMIALHALDRKETLIFAALFDLVYNDMNLVTIHELARKLKTSVLMLLNCKPQLNHLMEEQIIAMRDGSEDKGIYNYNLVFRINPCVSKCIIEGTPIEITPYPGQINCDKDWHGFYETDIENAPVEESNDYGDDDDDFDGDIETFTEHELLKDSRKKLMNSVVYPRTIEPKKLVFNGEVQHQMDELSTLLQEKKYQKLHKNMQKRGLSKAFVCCFYGAPGTGKTAMAYELARQSGRAILPVDITNTRSHFYGDSEKLVKNIFDVYAELCRKSSMTPILLLNEADGILGKRVENVENREDHSQNAIQGVLLNEMERMDGILIATTNLQLSFDAAFSRRILYKIEFTKPNLETKMQIWGNKLDYLSEEERRTLSQDYNLSGGEIDNIVRKASIHEILHNKRPDLKQLQDYCREEHFGGSKRVTIGF